MDHPSCAIQCSRCWNAPWVTILDKIPHIESNSAFSQDHIQSGAWESYFLGILAKTDRSRTEEPGGLQSMGSQRVRSDWVTEQTHTYRQKQDNGRWWDYTLLMADPKSSISTLTSSPLYTPAMHKQICRHPSFQRCHTSSPKTWACSDFLQPFSSSWGHFWSAFWGVKAATETGVCPSSPLLWRLERKEVSEWKGQEEGYGGWCQLSLDFFWEVSSWTPGTFLDSPKVSICVLLLIKLLYLILQNDELHLWDCLFLVSSLSLNPTIKQ